MITELTTDTLHEVIAQQPKVIVLFSASWCGNCRIMKPKFKKHALENPEICFVIIDAEHNPGSRKLADVTNLPTFATYVGGTLRSQTQTNKAELLAELISEIS
jgi:thioredoxin 1